jgi:hypothetical protein
VNLPLSRRAFLLGTATALGAAACSKSTPVIEVGGRTDAAPLNLLVTSGAPDGPDNQSVAVFVPGVEQRVAVILRGVSEGIAPAPGSVTLQVSTDQKHWGPRVVPDVHADTGATVSTYLTTNYRFPQPGTYWLRASYQGRTADAPVVVIDRSAAAIPISGDPMITTPTPTVVDGRGVNPVCTRKPSPCAFHTVSLDQALTQHRPIAVLFATPLLCQTATCGPVLESLIAASAPYAGRITFVHSEIYTDLTAKENAPAVKAYHLQSEPVLFLADAKGIVSARIDGLYGQAEAAAALARLMAT